MVAKGGAALAPINTDIPAACRTSCVDAGHGARRPRSSPGMFRVDINESTPPARGPPGYRSASGSTMSPARARRRRPDSAAGGARRPLALRGHHQALRGPRRQRRGRPRRARGRGPCPARRERRRQDDAHAHPLRADPRRRGPDPWSAGESVAIRSPRDAIAAGVGHGHPALLAGAAHDRGRERGPRPRQRRCGSTSRPRRHGRGGLRRASASASTPTRASRTCRSGEQQRVEILKALSRDCRILILDEPTAVLVPSEVEALFATLRRLVAEGLAVVFISHKLGEVRAISDRVSVLRRGRAGGHRRGRHRRAGAGAR